MAKASKVKEAEERARRKLADAQARLHSAQEKRTRMLQRGEQEIERARSRAADRVEKATTEVERRAGKVARAEARLLALQRKAVEAVGLAAPPGGVPESPLGAADRLENLTSDAIDELGAGEIVTVDGPGGQTSHTEATDRSGDASAE